MAKRGRITIEGGKLREMRLRRAMTQEEFGREIGLTGSRVAQIEKASAVGIFPSVLRGLSSLTGEPIERLLLGLSAKAPPEIPSDSIDPSSAKRVPEIPTFDLAVAAGPWTEVSQVAELRDPGQITDGRFRIFIRGDSMEADYPNGSLVEFRSLRWGIDEVELNADYYIQVDENATFKRLEKKGDVCVFRAVNRKRYPGSFEVRKSEIVRMAKAEYILKKAGSNGN